MRLPVRRSPRLRDYDYAQEGAYFVTICTQRREWFLGEVVNMEMRLSPSGEIAQQTWLELPNHYPNIELDEFVVMPNHVHGIVVITRAGLNPAPTYSCRKSCGDLSPWLRGESMS
jgi:putative transposase